MVVLKCISFAEHWKYRGNEHYFIEQAIQNEEENNSIRIVGRPHLFFWSSLTQGHANSPTKHVTVIHHDHNMSKFKDVFKVSFIFTLSTLLILR